MKRSEMLVLITERLYHEDILSPDCDNLAEELLILIESIGMFPPDNGKESTDVVSFISNCLQWDKE